MTHPLIQVAKIALQTEPIAYQGVRKIINGLTWDAGDFLCIKNDPLRYFDLGYGKNKHKQLLRNYVNEEEFARVRAVLDRRKDQSFTSVACSMRGASKGNRSMGHCILSVVVTRTKDEERVEVQYRSTELTLKFGGDLVFLPWVFDQLGVDPNHVTFRFANCYLSGVYLPYTFAFVKDPVSWLHEVWKEDPQFAANATRFVLRAAMTKDQFFPYSPENVAHRFLWSRIDKSAIKRVRGYLETRHIEFGPLDWARVHHQKGVYVPRGKRAATCEIDGEDE